MQERREHPSCFAAAVSGETHGCLPTEGELEKLSSVLKLCADSTRLRILYTLLGGEACVLDLCSQLGMTKSAVSHQLSLLRRSNFVASRRAGKNVFYRLSDAHVVALLDSARIHALECHAPEL